MSTGIFLPLIPRDKIRTGSDLVDYTLVSDDSTPTTASPRSVDSTSPLGIDALSLLHQDYDLLGTECCMLGRGASASVWAATARSTGAHVAVKTVDRDAYCSFAMNEAEVLRNLQSVPGVVRIIDSYSDASNEIIVMELCSGTDLQRWDTEELDTRTVKSILLDLLTILRNIHQLGFAHMDIRLENIIGDKSNITGVTSIKLVDFGSSIESVADAPIDIKNAGILLYELLSGIRFSEETYRPFSDLLVSDSTAAELIEMLMNASTDNVKCVIEKAMAHEWFH